MSTSISLKNINQPAPPLFQRIDKAVSLLTNASIVILLSMGYKDSSLLFLFLKIGISSIMQAIGAILAEAPIEVTATSTTQSNN